MKSTGLKERNLKPKQCTISKTRVNRAKRILYRRTLHRIFATRTARNLTKLAGYLLPQFRMPQSLFPPLRQLNSSLAPLSTCPGSAPALRHAAAIYGPAISQAAD